MQNETTATFQSARSDAQEKTLAWVEACHVAHARDFANCPSVRRGKLSATQLAAVTVALRAAADVLTAHGLLGTVTVDLGEQQGKHEIDNW